MGGGGTGRRPVAGPGRLPQRQRAVAQASGEAITTKAEQVKEFTLLRAYPDQKNDGLSLALEFSRPLVGTQDFDTLVRFEEKVGTEDSSWTLSDDGLTCATRSSRPARSSAWWSRRTCWPPMAAAWARN